MSIITFGIERTNRLDDQQRAKNYFNSSFPVVFACYMMENGEKSIFARLKIMNRELKVVCYEIRINELFRCKNKKASNQYFHFEAKFEPYQSIGRYATIHAPHCI